MTTLNRDAEQLTAHAKGAPEVIVADCDRQLAKRRGSSAHDSGSRRHHEQRRRVGRSSAESACRCNET